MADDSSSDWWEAQRAEHASGLLASALEYARHGMSVFPVELEGKRPMPGYGWSQLATTDVAAVVQDFTQAFELWGEDGTSIAWALGKDGYMAIDFDVPPEDYPEWSYNVVEHAAINPTRRGQHFIFREPDPANPPSNSTVKFPTSGWGDVRGRGGYIVVAGADRLGFDVGTKALACPFPFPEWLSPYSGGADAVSWEEARQFAIRCVGMAMPNKLNGLRDYCAAWDESRNGTANGRHEAAVWLMTVAAEEALAGYYPFSEAFKIVRDWWRQVTPSERHGREFKGIVCWAIAKAQVNAEAAEEEAAVEEADVELASPDWMPEPVDWTELWATDFGDHQWSVEGFWPRGRSMSLNAGAKTGKSEVALHVVTHLVRGVHPWTGETIEPQRVMYLDFEMTPEDLVDRLSDFGYDERVDLSLLRYYLLPTLPPLNTELGGRALMALVERDRPDVVVLDTFSRIYSGDENANADIQAFYRFVGLPLKRLNIGVLRLDHMGKDKTKGARGASAKNDDIDVAWELERREGGKAALKRTHTRVSWVPERVDLIRTVSPTGIVRYVTDGAEATMDNLYISGKAAELARLGMPKGLSKRAAAQWVKDHGAHPGRDIVFRHALRRYNAGLHDDVPPTGRKPAAEHNDPVNPVTDVPSTPPSTTPVDSDGE